MGAERTDEELMIAYAQGEFGAFEMLYQRNRNTLYRFIFRSIANRASADELFQETWSRVIAARERYQPEAKFSTYLLRIAHNLLVDHFRHSLPHAGEEETEAILRELTLGETEQPDRILSEFEQRRRLQIALEELPSQQREAFVLRMEKGLGLEEIATLTEVGHETVKSRLRYAFAKIRQRLAE